MSVSRHRATLSYEPSERVEAWLEEFLLAIGARKTDNWSGVAGSVDLAVTEYELPDGRTLSVERDNWIALALEGDLDIVTRARTELASALGASE